MSYLNEAMKKWAPVLDDEQTVAEHGALTGDRRRVTAIVMENTIREQQKSAQALQEAIPSSNTSNTANYDPVIVGLLRRAMPKLIAYDFAGVQPMTMPTGLIFAARNRYTSKTGAEALFNEADASFSAGGVTTAAAGTNPVDAVDGLSPWDATPGFTTPAGLTTAQGEDFVKSCSSTEILTLCSYNS